MKNWTFFKSWKDKICAVAPINPVWRHLRHHTPKIALERHAFVGPETKFFCMGSCFAREIHYALQARQYQVYPDEDAVQLETHDEPPFNASGSNLSYFNTFAMRQEFEKAFGLWAQSENDFWHYQRTIKKGAISIDVWQDPYRRRVYSKTLEGIRRITRDFDAVVKKGILESDVYIMTLGMTEIHKKKDNGLVTCVSAGSWREGASVTETEFYESSYEENYANMKAIVELIHGRFPERKIILTVSPVPLGGTYGKNDVYVANMESKSILRAVAGQMARKFKNVYYFPAFEICSYLGAFTNRKVYRDDWRHVDKEVIAYIIDRFLQSFHS